MRAKISMQTPLVEMDGDEMTRVLWPMIKEKLLLPYIDLKTDYYDLSIENRDVSFDQATIAAANAIKKYGVGVKNATITPNTDRVKEYNLKQEWRSPNGTIRAILDGTVFRKPILTKNIKPVIPSWEKPIIIGRHAYGDLYRNTELYAPYGGRVELLISSPEGKQTRETVIDLHSPLITQGIYNTIGSITNFARSCFEYALDQKIDCWFASKDTISKTYDATFKSIFAEVYEKEYQSQFEQIGTRYVYRLIDDVMRHLMKTEGGFLWACKNYDGDLMSDLVAAAYGSSAMMTSCLVSPDGYFEYEAAHGTIQKHYYRHMNNEKTSTNPVALIFAWTGALRKRGELDGIRELMNFSDKLEELVIQTIESGFMTADLAKISRTEVLQVLDSEEFMDRVAVGLYKWSRDEEEELV